MKVFLLELAESKPTQLLAYLLEESSEIEIITLFDMRQSPDDLNKDIK